MSRENRPLRMPVEPRIPPRFEHNPQAPLSYQTPPRRRAWHRQMLRFLDQMNRDFIHTKVAAIFSLLVMILMFLLLNPFTRRAIFLFIFSEQ